MACHSTALRLRPLLQRLELLGLGLEAVNRRPWKLLAKELRRVAVVGADVDHRANGAALESQKAPPVRL